MSENKPRPVVVLLALGFGLCVLAGLGTVRLVAMWNPWAVVVPVALTVGFGYVIARIARSQRTRD